MGQDKNWTVKTKPMTKCTLCCSGNIKYSSKMLRIEFVRNECSLAKVSAYCEHLKCE